MTELAFRADLKMATDTLSAIDLAIKKQSDDGMRPHLGASLIGRSCKRALWYSFRWVTPSDHSARLLRVFQRGHDEEPRLTKLLRDAGITVMTVDPETGKQFGFKDGHFGGSMDGAAHNIPEAPKTWHVLEYKTASAKMFNTLEAKGVREAKPEHWAQMQVYMHKMELTRALYITVCKDDDRLHAERVDYDAVAAHGFLDKAQSIIAASVPPDGISTDPSYFECKWCDHKALCHGVSAPTVTCRSCAHATPEREGNWTCGKHNFPDIDIKIQRQGCTEHLIIPALIAKWATVVDASQDENWVRYELVGSGGSTFTNGNPESVGKHISSTEIYSCKEKVALTDAYILELRQEFDGRFVA